MHEISLVRSILKTVEQQFPTTNIKKLKCIYIRAGELSNIQPILMQNAFEAVIQDEVQYANAKLNVEITPILIKCELCGEITEVKQYRFMCGCGNPCKNLIQGDELLISKVEFND